MTWRGIALALASAVLFGTSTPAAKILLGTVEPWMLASLLYVGAGFGLAVVFTLGRLTRSHSAEAPISLVRRALAARGHAHRWRP
jgi:drug/metabolite transporter (DMT)-like permease